MCLCGLAVITPRLLLGWEECVNTSAKEGDPIFSFGPWTVIDTFLCFRLFHMKCELWDLSCGFGCKNVANCFTGSEVWFGRTVGLAVLTDMKQIQL